MPSAVDARGVRVSLPAPPRRIVSLVPSTTETLHALVGPERIVGVTRFCVHPQPWVSGVPKVGGTKDLELDRLVALEPDLVVGNVEENTKEIAEVVEERFPLWMAFPRSVEEALEDLRAMARLVGEEARGEAIAARIGAARSTPRPFRFVYLIWRRPWMAAGRETFISAMLEEVGGENLLEGRYPELAPEELVALDPERVLLPSEPFPFSEKHVDELVALGLPRERVRLVDGELCSWHGVRMKRGLPYVASLAPG